VAEHSVLTHLKVSPSDADMDLSRSNREQTEAFP
jgi:hypothetical protein